MLNFVFGTRISTINCTTDNNFLQFIYTYSTFHLFLYDLEHFQISKMLRNFNLFCYSYSVWIANDRSQLSCCCQESSCEFIIVQFQRACLHFAKNKLRNRCCFSVSGIVCSKIPVSRNVLHIETSQLICNVSQLTGLYVIWVSTGRSFTFLKYLINL